MEFSRNPVDISNQLESNRTDIKGDALLPSAELFSQWESFKKELNNQYDLQFGIDYLYFFHNRQIIQGLLCINRDLIIFLIAIKIIHCF